LQLSRPLAEHFAFPGVDGQRTGGVPAELYLDLDDDPRTGVEPFWADESAWADELVGYEAEIDVLLGFDFVTRDDDSEGYGAGDVIIDDAEHEITGHFADYWLIDTTEDRRLGPAAGDGGIDFGLPDTRPLTTIDGDVIELRVPLAWLDLEAGDVVRLMYRENDQGPVSGLGYSRNARLRVR
jgi:hypothetical protein